MNIAIILAAGNGTRFLARDNVNKLPKQFYEFCRKEVIAYSLETFNSHPDIDKIVVVANYEYIKKTEDIIKKNNFDKVIKVVPGGVNRQASSYSALKYLESLPNLNNPKVLIHDAARLFVTKELISRNLKALDEHNAVTSVIKVNDTVIEANGIFKGPTLDRDKIYLVQTPQAFRFDTLISAHRYAKTLNDQTFTDDASLMKLLNEDVYLVEGDKTNLKLTTEDDLIILKALYEAKENNK